MHELFIYIKYIALVAIVYCADLIILSFASLSIISPNVREFLIDFKEIISALVSLSALILVVFKIINERKKGKSIVNKTDE